MLINPLNSPYDVPGTDENSSTKEKILAQAAIMFARNGYTAVSMRDIAMQVNIKAASIYNHFESKEVLWEAIMENTQALYLRYFQRLEGACATVNSFDELLDVMFLELWEPVEIFTYYSFSLVIAAQFSNAQAYEIYSKIFLAYSIAFIRAKFDACVEKGWAQPFDTQGCSTFFMHGVLTGITLRVHEDLGQEVPYQVKDMFEQIRQAISQMAQKAP